MGTLAKTSYNLSSVLETVFKHDELQEVRDLKQAVRQSQVLGSKLPDLRSLDLGALGKFWHTGDLLRSLHNSRNQDSRTIIDLYGAVVKNIYDRLVNFLQAAFHIKKSKSEQVINESFQIQDIAYNTRFTVKANDIDVSVTTVDIPLRGYPSRAIYEIHANGEKKYALQQYDRAGTAPHEVEPGKKALTLDLDDVDQETGRKRIKYEECHQGGSTKIRLSDPLVKADGIEEDYEDVTFIHSDIASSKN